MPRGRTCPVGPRGSRKTRPVEIIRVKLVPARTQSILKVTIFKHKYKLISEILQSLWNNFIPLKSSNGPLIYLKLV